MAFPLNVLFFFERYASILRGGSACVCPSKLEGEKT
jgi:hypothetical protein